MFSVLSQDLLTGFDPATTWIPGALFVATFLSEDLACIAAGMLVAQGATSLPTAVLSCAAGIFVSDLGLYGMGRAAALGLLRWRALRRHVTPERIERWRGTFDKRGLWILFASRFLPGSRVPIYIVAGAVGWSFPLFAAILAVAALVWTPALVWVAMHAGSAMQSWLHDAGRAAWLIVPAGIGAVWVLVHNVPRMFSWRGRREIRGSLRRLLAWEYWPTWLVYAPVAAWLVALAARYRCWAVFTACNPGMPHGGIALESKGEILDMIAAGGHCSPSGLRIARYHRLPKNMPLQERVDAVAAWLTGCQCVVLKPDQGERGIGVQIIRTVGDARAWFDACPVDAVLQEHVSGPEFGVVWHRLADGTGEIRSIAHKVSPSVVGDGQRSVEDLILADRREVAMIRFYRRVLDQAFLERIPAADEEVRLGELGTHSRGAAFLGADEHNTPAVLAMFDTAMVGVDGLDFGRFDVRAASIEDFVAGRATAVIEFNGVTGEPAHIYQPGYPWWAGLRDLCAHWSAACATGNTNRSTGRAHPSSLRELWRLLVEIRRHRAFEAPHRVPDSSELESQLRL